MMQYKRISIIPVELFTFTKRSEFEERLKIKGVIKKSTVLLSQTVSELSGETSSFYEHIDYQLNKEIFLSFCDSSLSIILIQSKEINELSSDAVIAELNDRKRFHQRILTNANEDSVNNVLIELDSAKDSFNYNVNYVFSFYVFPGDIPANEEQRMNLRLLSEPSILDIDDMVSSDEAKSRVDPGEIKKDFLKNIQDVDISGKAETYVTWATIVSAVRDDEDWGKTLNLLIALEVRLQSVWNRCYSYSRYIDNVFERKIVTRNINDIYWSFVKTLDDANSVLTSTFSSRANVLFQEMIKTSRLRDEILRLQQKLELLEKFIDQQNNATYKKTSRIIEILLFFSAISGLVQLFFKDPIFPFPVIGYIFLSLAVITGIYILWKLQNNH